MTHDLATGDSPVILTLMEAGPGTGLLRHLKLKPPMSVKAGTAFAAALIAVTWLPLAILSVADGNALRGVTIPFIDDLVTHARFLFALPVLVLAEFPIARRIRHIVGHFLSAGLVLERETDRFSDAIADSVRLRDSRIAELLLIVATALACWFAARRNLSVGTGTWYQPGNDGSFSPAGIWYVFVSTPIFQFMLIRWIYRMMVWTRFLWLVSKLDLRLTPSHPDAVGGLLFLGRSVVPFGNIMFALSAVISASVATKVLFAGASLTSYWPTWVALVTLSVIVFSGPLLVFVPKLLAVKQRGLAEYGILASQYTQLFESKWIRGQPSAEESLLGTGDIQSLADLGNSFQMVRKMRFIPIDGPVIISIAVSAILPALPLIATEVPLKVIGTTLLRLVT